MACPYVDRNQNLSVSLQQVEVIGQMSIGAVNLEGNVSSLLLWQVLLGVSLDAKSL